MPPEQKVSKKDILDAAFQLTREYGFEHITARRIAKALDCSTQPIYRAYENMPELKADVFQRANACFGEFLMNYPRDNHPFLCIGIAYIEFAERERNLFRMLFLSGNLDMHSLSELTSGSEHGFVLGSVPQSEDADPKKAERVFRNLWLYTHGIASMVATNDLALPKEEVREQLTGAFKAFNALGEM